MEEKQKIEKAVRNHNKAKNHSPNQRKANAPRNALYSFICQA